MTTTELTWTRLEKRDCVVEIPGTYVDNQFDRIRFRIVPSDSRFILFDRGQRVKGRFSVQQAITKAQQIVDAEPDPDELHGPNSDDNEPEIGPGNEPLPPLPEPAGNGDDEPLPPLPEPAGPCRIGRHTLPENPDERDLLGRTVDQNNGRQIRELADGVAEQYRTANVTQIQNLYRRLSKSETRSVRKAFNRRLDDSRQFAQIPRT